MSGRAGAVGLSDRFRSRSVRQNPVGNDSPALLGDVAQRVELSLPTNSPGVGRRVEGYRVAGSNPAVSTLCRLALRITERRAIFFGSGRSLWVITFALNLLHRHNSPDCMGAQVPLPQLARLRSSRRDEGYPSHRGPSGSSGREMQPASLVVQREPDQRPSGPPLVP